MRLRVSSTCSRKLSQSWSGQSLSTVASAEMKVLFECGNRMLGRIDLVAMGWDKVDAHAVGPDVGFKGLGTLIVHDIERWCISTCI
jgi:hypothetical protein